MGTHEKYSGYVKKYKYPTLYFFQLSTFSKTVFEKVTTDLGQLVKGHLFTTE